MPSEVDFAAGKLSYVMYVMYVMYGMYVMFWKTKYDHIKL